MMLVDIDGRLRGTADGMAAHHQPGLLHSAVSVVLRNASGLALIQRRASSKRLFAGWWSNSCCTHPFPGETAAAAARRRVEQELGLVVDRLNNAGTFIYRCRDQRSGLVEFERDTVFVGETGAEPTPDPAEIDEWAWVDIDAEQDRRAFTPWADTVHALALFWWRTHGSR